MKQIKKIILFVFLICLSLSFTFFKIDANTNYTIDLSTSDSQETNITYSELIYLLTNTNTTQNENKYFEYVNKSFTALKINKLIPKSNITFSLNENDLTVHAYSYSYSDKAGNTHIYVPTKIYCGTSEMVPTYVDSYYECEFQNVSSTVETVNVQYKCEYILNKDEINTLLNLAYNDAKNFVSNKVEETQNAIYSEKLSQYNQYLNDLNKYNTDTVAYQSYLIEKENYDNEKSKYDEYLLALDEYNIKNKEYQDYLLAKDEYAKSLSLYQQYLKDLENYNTELAAYNEALPSYTETMNKINHQILVVDTIGYGMIFGSGDNQEERSIKDAVLGGTVTSVLSQKADLNILNADQSAIDRAETATINLREIFTQYFEKETDKDKYSFYCYREGFSFANYKKLKTNMEELLRCLDKLYRSGRVEEALIVKGKKEKYLFLVAQLAYVCNALSDDVVYNYEAWVSGQGSLSRSGALIFDENWTIDGRTINQILGDNVNLIEDNTVTTYPLSSGYPNELVAPTAPVSVSEPTIPAIVNEPTKPSVVAEPTAPAVVAEPVEPTKVEEPTPFTVDTDFRNVINDYNNSILTQRELATENKTIEIETNVTKNFRDTDKITIEFYDNNDNQIGTESTEKGSYIVFTNKPKKDKDAINKEYIFKGWAYEDGSILDLNNVQKNGFVYPIYEEVKQEYIVTWNVDGIETDEIYYYGDDPFYKGDLSKPINNNYYYVFSEWDKEKTSVDSNVTYTAIFIEREIFKGASNLIINNRECSLELDEVNDLDLTRFINDYPTIRIMKIKTPLYEIDGINLFTLRGETKLNVNVSNTNGEYTIAVSTSTEAYPIENYLYDFTLYGEFDPIHSCITVNDNKKLKKDERINHFVEGKISNNSVTFTLYSGKEYTISKYYNISYTYNSNNNISVNGTKYKENDNVLVNIYDIGPSNKIDSIYYVNSKNERVEIYDNSFVMPADDIYLGINLSIRLYTVKFIDNDNVIESKQYKYGEELIVPVNPTRLSDEFYSYNFIGWKEEDEIVEVCKFVEGDHTYIASFEAVESNLGPLEQSMGKIIPTIIIVSIIIIGTPFLIVFINKKKKKEKEVEYIDLSKLSL